MRVADIPAVIAIEEESFPVPWPAHAYQRELTQNDLASCLILETVDGSVIGHGCIWMVVDEVHISTIAIANAWRGKRLGELLLIELIQIGITRGGVMATLEVRVSNQVAQALYAKLDFEVVGFRKAYYTDNRENALIMTVEPLDAAYQARLQAERRTILNQFQAAPPADV
jgi:ribosomal-protein-alanine N-acetyltransferase